MKVKWKFYKNNIATDNFLAVLKRDEGKKKGDLVMYIYADSHLYKAIPYSDYSFIGRITFPCKEAKDYVNFVFDCSNLSSEEIAFKCLEYACCQIEANFHKRVAALIEDLS